jgi:enoyl-CoA hydratase/carnithine racemase
MVGADTCCPIRLVSTYTSSMKGQVFAGMESHLGIGPPCSGTQRLASTPGPHSAAEQGCTSSHLSDATAWTPFGMVFASLMPGEARGGHSTHPSPRQPIE